MPEVTTDAPQESGGTKTDNHQENPKWWNPRWTLGIGLPLFAIAIATLFIACRYYVGHPNDTPAFVAGVIGLLTLATIVAQAVIYKRQSDLMREGLDKTQSLIKQNRKALRISRQQTKIAEDALEHTKKMFTLVERSYIAIYRMDVMSKPAVGANPGIRIIFKNTGRTPADNFFAVIRIGFGKPDSTSEWIRTTYPVDISEHQMVGTPIDSGIHRVVEFEAVANEVLDKEALDVIENDGRICLYVIGEAHYRDFEGEPRIFQFIVQYDPADNGGRGGFIQCDR